MSGPGKLLAGGRSRQPRKHRNPTRARLVARHVQNMIHRFTQIDTDFLTCAMPASSDSQVIGDLTHLIAQEPSQRDCLKRFSFVEAVVPPSVVQAAGAIRYLADFFWHVPAHHFPRAMTRGLAKPAAWKASATSGT
jgi:hypothetical protein